MNIQYIHPKTDYPVPKKLRLTAYRNSFFFKIEKFLFDFIYNYLTPNKNKEITVIYYNFHKFIFLDFVLQRYDKKFIKRCIKNDKEINSKTF